MRSRVWLCRHNQSKCDEVEFLYHIFDVRTSSSCWFSMHHIDCHILLDKSSSAALAIGSHLSLAAVERFCSVLSTVCSLPSLNKLDIAGPSSRD